MLKGIKFKSGTSNPPPEFDSIQDKRGHPSSPTHLEAFAWEEQPRKKKWKKEVQQEEPLEEMKDIQQEEKPANKKKQEINKSEEKINGLCQQMWDSFLKNEVTGSANICQRLISEQHRYYDILSGKMAVSDEGKSSKGGRNPELFVEGKAGAGDSKPINFRSRESMIADRVRDKKVDHDYDDMAKDFFHKYKNIISKDDYNDQEYADKDIGKDDGDPKKLNKNEKKRLEKIKNLKKAQESKTRKATERLLDSCGLCLANNRVWEEQIICCGTYTMMILPKQKRYDSFFFVNITSIDHYSSSLEVDEEVYDEIRNFMKCLVMAADKKDLCAIFFETAINLKKLDHFFIECVLVPEKLKADVEMYFKKSLTEIESEWSVHKKIIEIKREKGGIRKQIPKNFPFFYVDFNLSHGYAHIVEKEREFSREDHHEVLATALKIDKHKVLRPEHLNKEEVNKMREQFIGIWDEFDWTKHI